MSLNNITYSQFASPTEFVHPPHRYGWLRSHHCPEPVDGAAYVDSCLTSQSTLVKPISHTKPYKPATGVPSMKELPASKHQEKITFTSEWAARLDFYLHVLVHNQVDIRILSKVVDECPRRFMYAFTTCRRALENASLHTFFAFFSNTWSACSYASGSTR
jgi:hypothetical protein